MEITEKERLMLVKKQEEICGLTLRILDMACDPKNLLEIKKNITIILSLLNTIASYSDVKKKNLDVFTTWANLIFYRFYLVSKCDADLKDPHGWRKSIVSGNRGLEEFCNAVNSINFDFTKRGLKITLPKITLPKSLNIGIITNK
jgi:hypothetical protein